MQSKGLHRWLPPPKWADATLFQAPLQRRQPGPRLRRVRFATRWGFPLQVCRESCPHRSLSAYLAGLPRLARLEKRALYLHQPASIDTAMYRQSLIAAGGCAPIITSRAIPPELPAAKAKTKTPNKSSLCLTPAVAPLSANTKVPPRSNATSSVFTTICSLTIN